MELWEPAPDEPEQLDWWRPLLAVKRRAQAQHVPSPLHTEEFVFRGRVDRGASPAVWIYEHRRSGREMIVDGKGRTYEFIRYRRGHQLGRFNEIGVWPALLRARFCRSSSPGSSEFPRVVRRGHLTLVPTPPSPN